MVRYSLTDNVAIVSLDNPPVNALSVAVRKALCDALDQANADPKVRAIVLTSESGIFCGGADITEFGKPPLQPSLPKVLAKAEASAKPVVTAVEGVCFGGGLELALACHGRVASSGAKFALPEVKLGLIPGSGGTQRLPRLVSPAEAFDFMLKGDPVSAFKAHDIGMVDAVVNPEDLRAAAIGLALQLASQGVFPVVRDLTDKFTQAAREAFEVRAAEALKKSGQLDSTARLIEAVRAVFEMPFEDGLLLERDAFMDLLAGTQSQALRYVFFSEREAGKVAQITRDTPLRPVNRVAVIGAGTMGGGIALAMVAADLPVTLIETDEASLENGLKRIWDTLNASVKRGSLPPEKAQARFALIDGRVGLEAVADADLIIEAVFEELGVKQDLFRRLDGIAKSGAILATNTSYLDVNQIAAVTARPQDVIGLHFFSPANVMRLLEVVRAEHTLPEVLATAMKLSRRINKLAVVSGVCFGFIGNRMLAQRGRAAERLLLRGASPKAVDDAITGFGFRMGHFAMADLSGLDIGYRIRRAFGGFAPVADALCDLNRMGQKTGRGFYQYPDGARQGVHDPEVDALITSQSQKMGLERRDFSQDEIIEHLFYPMVNEGAKILEEGIAARPGDIDMVWINGYGWPAWKGGPMFWADQVGLKTIIESLERQAEAFAEPALKPSRLLRTLAESDLSFAGFGRKG